MKANEKKELHVKSMVELRKLLKDAEEALLTLQLELSQAKLANTSSLSLKRQEIAILQTILGEKAAMQPVEETREEHKSKTGSHSKKQVTKEVQEEKEGRKRKSTSQK